MGRGLLWWPGPGSVSWQEHSTAHLALTLLQGQNVDSTRGRVSCAARRAGRQRKPRVPGRGTHSGQGFLDVLSSSRNVAEDHAGAVLLQTSAERTSLFFH